MIDTSTEPLVHKMNGQAILKCKCDLLKLRYHAAVLLHLALINNEFDLAELARINLVVALQYCKSMSSFFEATQLLKGGLNLCLEMRSGGSTMT
jgi:hypothetical protein